MEDILNELRNLLLEHPDAELKVLVDTGNYKDVSCNVYSEVRNSYVEYLAEYCGYLYSREDLEEVLLNEYSSLYDNSSDILKVVKNRLDDFDFIETIVIILNS